MACGTCNDDVNGASGAGHGPADNDLYRDLCSELFDVVRRYSKRGVHVRVTHDEENEIMRIAGPRTTQAAMAAAGLEEILELAQVTAEHHPYWGLLYNLSDVADSILKEWNGTMSADQIDSIVWSLSEMSSMIENIKTADLK